jgi:hypothetical protein
MDYEIYITRRKFLLSIPFFLNINLKKNMIIEVHNNNGSKIFYKDEVKIEEVSFKIIKEHINATTIEIKYSGKDKYLFKKLLWKVPLFEDLNLWSRQKWDNNNNKWNEDDMELFFIVF